MHDIVSKCTLILTVSDDIGLELPLISIWHGEAPNGHTSARCINTMALYREKSVSVSTYGMKLAEGFRHESLLNLRAEDVQ